MKGVVFAVLAIAIQLVNGQRTARVECYDNGNDYSMIFTVTSNNDPDLNFVYALNSTDQKVDACTSDSVPSPFTNTSDEFKISITVTKAFAVDADCGDTNTDTEFQWRFLTTKFADTLVKSMDILYVAKCNFSDATSTSVSTGITVTGESLENLAPDESITFDLQVVDGSSNVLTSVALGDQIKLKIVQSGGRAVTVSGHSCEASPDGVFDASGEFDLLGADGCPLRGYVASGFTGQLSSSETGLFEQFQFVGTSNVYYQCIVKYCFSSDTSCQDFCTFSTNGRRRRDATEDTLARTSVRISINRYHPSVRQAQGCLPVTDSSPEPVASCLDNVGVIAAFAVLGALLLMTIAVSVCLYLRSIRLIRKPEKGTL